MASQLKRMLLAATAALAIEAAAHAAAPANAPWMNPSLSPDQRAAMVVQQMTQAEKLQMVFGYFATNWQGKHPPAGVRYGSAGFIAGPKSPV